MSSSSLMECKEKQEEEELQRQKEELDMLEVQSRMIKQMKREAHDKLNKYLSASPSLTKKKSSTVQQSATSFSSRSASTRESASTLVAVAESNVEATSSSNRSRPSVCFVDDNGISDSEDEIDLDDDRINTLMSQLAFHAFVRDGFRIFTHPIAVTIASITLAQSSVEVAQPLAKAMAVVVASTAIGTAVGMHENKQYLKQHESERPRRLEKLLVQIHLYLANPISPHVRLSSDVRALLDRSRGCKIRQQQKLQQQALELAESLTPLGDGTLWNECKFIAEGTAKGFMLGVAAVTFSYLSPTSREGVKDAVVGHALVNSFK